MNPNAIKALKALWKDAELPGEASFEDVNVPVPEGFSSLFSDIKIKVFIPCGDTFEFNWIYKHPDGGSNGKLIGYVFYDTQENKWAWRNDTKFNEAEHCYNHGHIKDE